MRTVALLSAAILILALVGVGVADNHRTESVKKSIAPDGADRIDVAIEFGAGEIWIDTDDGDDAASFDITYDPRVTDFDVTYDVRGGVGYVSAESERFEDEDIDEDDNEWVVSLSKRYPLSLEMDIGACDAEMNLGGLRLSRLDLEVGAADADISFNEPNPDELEEISIEAGAASLDMRDIGNANFRFFEFEGGVGSFDLDFRGEYRGESQIDIEVGLGSADIILPEGVPCRIENAEGNFLSSVDIHGGEGRLYDDVWESRNFDGARERIIVRLDVGLGSVDIYFK